MTKAYFEGEVRTEWLVETATGDDAADRRMQLLEDFAFVDPSGTRWLAPLGHIVDGASIPRVLWAVAGSPYTGAYRRASVLHDAACDARAVASKLVHRMFYDAMICDGVSQAQAIEFYTAVRLFGPSWDDPPLQLARGRRRSKPTRKVRPKRSFAEVEKALDAVLDD